MLCCIVFVKARRTLPLRLIFPQTLYLSLFCRTIFDSFTYSEGSLSPDGSEGVVESWSGLMGSFAVVRLAFLAAWPWLHGHHDGAKKASIPDAYSTD